MIEETFADGSSFIHRLDPRVKTVAAIGFSVLTAVADSFPPLFFALGFAIVLVGLARLRPRAVMRRLLLVNGFVLLLWLMLPLTFGGEPIARIGPVTISAEGIRYALLITLKSNAIILACIALLATTHLTELGRALGWLRAPQKIVHILLFMLRYLGEISKEYQRLSVSMRVRCFQPSTNLHTYRSYANMVGMLLVNSYERAEAVYAAMLCRGFHGKFYALDDFAVDGDDVAFGILVVAALSAMAVLQWFPLFG